ncbi:Lpg1974 family pore-forming outer membrane protein [Legionella sainthelensi]|uniref:Lpg1974 family pore-forming outer membrane protein n=1 Tax=Legionella sainthelensi TaxID=28087 RepID=UPI001E5F81B6|nr:Lpg1974 family pore-forming outer membrane protein [Legionella sainthelensi]
MGAKVGYDFGNSANSLEFDYLHFNNTSFNVGGSNGDPYSFAAIFFPDVILPDLASIDLVIHSQLKYNLNQYDIWLAHTFGSYVTNFNFKPSIGLRYASLEHNLTFDTPGAVKSHFEGVGPEICFDALYALGHGLGIIGHFDVASLASSVNASSYLTVNAFGINAAFKSPNIYRISNAITGRIGANFKYAFNNASSLTLEGGYQVISYSDAFDMIQGEVLPIEQHIVGINSDNFSLRGDYLSLTYHV